jgi:hypothetical protein
VAGFLELSFELGALGPEAAEEACFACGASAVTFMDAADDPVLEPLPGEVRLWRTTQLRALSMRTPMPPRSPTRSLARSGSRRRSLR